MDDTSGDTITEAEWNAWNERFRRRNPGFIPIRAPEAMPEAWVLTELRYRKLRAENTDMKNELIEKAKEIARLQRELDAKTADAVNYKQRYEDARMKYNALADQLAEHEKTSRVSESQLQLRIDILENQHATDEKEIRELTQSVEELKEENKRLESANAELEKQLQSANECIAKLMDKLEAAEKRITVLEANASALEAHVSVLEADRDRTKALIIQGEVCYAVDRAYRKYLIDKGEESKRSTAKRTRNFINGGRRTLGEDVDKAEKDAGLKAIVDGFGLTEESLDAYSDIKATRGDYAHLSGKESMTIAELQSAVEALMPKDPNIDAIKEMLAFISKRDNPLSPYSGSDM